MSIKKIHTAIVAVSTILLSPSFAYASSGVGAQVYGCVYLAAQPEKPITYHFSVADEGTRGMSETGKSATLKVKSKDISCVSLGYVAAKCEKGDKKHCAAHDHQWSLTYKADNTTSGSASTHWIRDSSKYAKVELAHENDSTMICEREELCSGKLLELKHVFSPSAYIIFQPNRTIANKLKNTYQNIKKEGKEIIHNANEQIKETTGQANVDRESIRIHKKDSHPINR